MLIKINLLDDDKLLFNDEVKIFCSSDEKKKNDK